MSQWDLIQVNLIEESQNQDGDYYCIHFPALQLILGRILPFTSLFPVFLSCLLLSLLYMQTAQSSQETLNWSKLCYIKKTSLVD